MASRFDVRTAEPRLRATTELCQTHTKAHTQRGHMRSSDSSRN